MTDEARSIVADIEVVGTPEEVWAAIATGPGISAWYVPHEIEECTGGTMFASFGPGMDVVGRVAAWEPPNRVVFDAGEGADGLAFEWMVEAHAGGTCVVRLVNSGFGSGQEWDDQYDAMAEGWRLFMFNLQLHLEHFCGRAATAALPMATWDVPRTAAWDVLTQRLGIDARPSVGDTVDIRLPDGLGLTGTVADAGEHSISLVLAEPDGGTAFIAADGAGDKTSVSIWSYFYGPDQVALAEREAPRWAAWLDANSPSPT